MSRTAPQPALFRDRAEVVDIESARRTPTVRCPACGSAAPRVMVSVGLDLHECRCGAYSERRHCCGAIALSPPPTRAYRERGECPGCGVSRWPRRTAPVDLASGSGLVLPNPLGAMVEAEFKPFKTSTRVDSKPKKGV